MSELKGPEQPLVPAPPKLAPETIELTKKQSGARPGEWTPEEAAAIRRIQKPEIQLTPEAVKEAFNRRDTAGIGGTPPWGEGPDDKKYAQIIADWEVQQIEKRRGQR